MTPVLAQIVGWELLAVVGVIVLLFGSAQLPRLARSMGGVKQQFEAGLRDTNSEQESASEEVERGSLR